eukprot:EG_transcript_28794
MSFVHVRPVRAVWPQSTAPPLPYGPTSPTSASGYGWADGGREPQYGPMGGVHIIHAPEVGPDMTDAVADAIARRSGPPRSASFTGRLTPTGGLGERTYSATRFSPAREGPIRRLSATQHTAYGGLELPPPPASQVPYGLSSPTRRVASPYGWVDGGLEPNYGPAEFGGVNIIQAPVVGPDITDTVTDAIAQKSGSRSGSVTSRPSPTPSPTKGLGERTPSA